MKDDTALKVKIVLAMLPDVPFEGWSRAALRKAAAKLLGFSVNWLDKAVAEFRTKEPEPPKKKINAPLYDPLGLGPLPK